MLYPFMETVADIKCHNACFNLETTARRYFPEHLVVTNTHQEFQNTLEDGLSLIVIDPMTENLIGVSVATDLKKSTVV